MLAPAGTFLTQQVGGDYNEFRDALGLGAKKPRLLWDRELATRQLEAVGMEVVEGEDGAEEISFADAGALAWYLKAIPWVVEGFSIASHRAQLDRFQARCETSGPVTIGQPAFWLKAVRAA